MRNSPFWIILVCLMVLLDFYVFQAVKTLSQSTGSKTKSIIYISYWGLSAISLIIFLVLPYLNLENLPKGFRNSIFAFIVALFFSKMIAAVFFFIDDIRRGIQWMAGKAFFSNTEGAELQEGEKITRSLFFTWLGMAAGSGLLGSLIYGFSNKYNYKVKKLALQFPNLPPSFKGLKIIQISDVHSGSFNDKPAVQRGIDKILQLKPDLILFTGDLVNNKADEMVEYINVFNQLNAPLGIYSILGNHDYGDYVQWDNAKEKTANLDKLKSIHAQLGWKLMLNENTIIRKGEDKIAVLGVENWSAKARFPKYGKLRQAHAGTENVPFKILLSHDPSHWEGEVLTTYRDIDLMLAGHTHGMQFGVEIPWLKWSPVQYVYKQWAGLYEKDAQKLYVNRGFGFIGYPGRVGILPEITLVELV
ncbi:MAG: metallophosphoesterase [Bacteroidota bacterium]|nr:metallophosphoesterase [Bacteroidota bacterium]